MSVMGNVQRRKRENVARGVDTSITAKTRQPTYLGNPCNKCGSSVRFVADHRCVRCLRQWRRDNEHRYYRKYGGSLFRKLGITPADFYAMAESQGWACLICEQIPENLLHVDHDHKTGEIRGLLCGGCNVGLGHFRDDPARLLKAAAYLVGK